MSSAIVARAGRGARRFDASHECRRWPISAGAPQPPVPGLVRALRVDRYQTTRAAVHLSAPGASASWLVEQLRAACLAEPCDVSILKRQ